MVLIFLVFLIMSFIGGGLNGALVKIGTQEIPPLTLTALRFVSALIILFPFWFRTKQYINPREFYKLLPFSLNVTLFSIGIQYTSIVIAVSLYNFVPIVVAVIGYFLLKETLSRVQVIGLIIAIMGVGVLLKGSFETQDILSFGTPLGNIIIILAVCLFSFYPIFGRSLGKKYNQPTILFFTFLITLIFLCFLLPFEWQVRPFVVSKITSSGILSVFGLATASSVIYYFLYQWLINKTSAFVSSLTQYSSVAFAILIGAVFFREHVTFVLGFGIFLTLVGVFLATTYQKIRSYRRPVLQ